MKNVDIVFISNAKNGKLYQETKTAIESLYKSENFKEIFFKVYVVESNKDIDYSEYNSMENGIPRSVQTIHPDVEFGYHTYLNIGRKAGNSEYVVLCNNDLTFGDNWATNAIKTMESRNVWSAGCFNPNKNIHQNIKRNSTDNFVYGLGISKEVTGWVIFQKRVIYDSIGDLDEDFKFWYCDNWYATILKSLGLYHILLLDSVVYHHDTTQGSTLSSEEDLQRKKDLTTDAVKLFNKKIKQLKTGNYKLLK